MVGAALEAAVKDRPDDVRRLVREIDTAIREAVPAATVVALSRAAVAYKLGRHTVARLDPKAAYVMAAIVTGEGSRSSADLEITARAEGVQDFMRIRPGDRLGVNRVAEMALARSLKLQAR